MVLLFLRLITLESYFRIFTYSKSQSLLLVFPFTNFGKDFVLAMVFTIAKSNRVISF